LPNNSRYYNTIIILFFTKGGAKLHCPLPWGHGRIFPLDPPLYGFMYIIYLCK